MFLSTCADCKQVLEVTFTGQTSHPTCNPSEVFNLTQQWCEAAQREDEPECKRLQREINKVDQNSYHLGSSALWYAQQGWPVFPLLPGQKVPATSQGFKDATIDEERIKQWWTEHPESNIGLPTGVFFDVVDIDGPTGIQSLTELGDDALPTVHAKVGTPRGFHYYVSATGGGNRAGVFPGIDYRGQGGYVVAPPSLIDFKRYTWSIQPSPEIRKS